MSVKKTVATAVAGAGTAAVLSTVIAFTPGWEGMDKVARRDAVGTGHPITYCYGQTDEFGKVKVGQRFTKQECDEKLKESMERIYIPGVSKCVHRPVPVKVMAAYVDGSYNAGVGRMCNSQMVAIANKTGDFRRSCDAFNNWIITGNHQVLPGLIARRAGELHGDHRKSERALCLEGASDPKTEWYVPTGAAVVEKPTPTPEPKKSWWRR